MVLAAGGWPGWWTVGWVTAAMVGGRTCAMATNRVVDRWIDARNPRTAGRHLPRGVLGVWRAAAAGRRGRRAHVRARRAMLNPLCLALWRRSRSSSSSATPTPSASPGSRTGSSASPTASPPPAAGSRCAARSKPPAFVIWFALTVWIGGFDLIYACQDVEVDRAQGLHSFPARFGVRAALIAARVNHALTALALADTRPGSWRSASVLLGRLARGRGAVRLRALAGAPARSLAARRRVLQRERLHRGDRARRGRARPALWRRRRLDQGRGRARRCSRASPAATTS